ncbi:uncharacterized protein LOC144167776 isoform X1 [Haemaphysalis longicornis]
MGIRRAMRIRVAVRHHYFFFPGSLVLVYAFLNFVNSTTFRSCGGKPGVVTATKSAALGAKILSTCGSKILLKHSFSSKSATKILDAICVGIHICYAYHSDKIKHTSAYKSNLSDCFASGILLLNEVRPDLYEYGATEIMSYVKDVTSCIKGDLIPTDPRVALAAVGYVRKVLFQGPGR